MTHANCALLAESEPSGPPDGFRDLIRTHRCHLCPKSRNTVSGAASNGGRAAKDLRIVGKPFENLLSLPARELKTISMAEPAISYSHSV